MNITAEYVCGMTGQVLPNEILREIVHNCPPEDRLVLALTFRGSCNAFEDILGLAVAHIPEDKNAARRVITVCCRKMYTIGIGRSGFGIIMSNSLCVLRGQPNFCLKNLTIIHDNGGNRPIIDYQDSALQEYMKSYEPADDQHRFQSSQIAHKLFWKMCKFYAPPIIWQFIYDQVQLMECQLREQ